MSMTPRLSAYSAGRCAAMLLLAAAPLVPGVLLALVLLMVLL